MVTDCTHHRQTFVTAGYDTNERVSDSVWDGDEGRLQIASICD